MKHLTNDIWLDADSQSYTVLRKGVYGSGKSEGEEKLEPISYHSTSEQVHRKIIDLALMEYVNGDYKRAMSFFNEAHANILPALKELNKRRYP